MYKLHFTATLISALTIGSNSAFAQGFYVDGGYSSLSTDYEETDSISLDLDFDAVGGHVGYEFNRYFGLEAEGLLGLSDETVTVYGTADDVYSSPDLIDDEEYEELDVELGLNYLVGAFAKANWPIHDNFTAFGRVGYAAGELELNASAEGESFSDSEVGDGFAYGVGLMIDVPYNFFIRGDYTIYNIEDAETDAWMLGAGIRF